MKCNNNRFGRAASISAGVALGMLAAGCASRQANAGEQDRQSSRYDTTGAVDSTGPYGPYDGGTMGGSGVGEDTLYQQDTSQAMPGDTSSYPYGSPVPGTPYPGGSGGGTGLDTMGLPDSLYTDTAGGLNPYGTPGTGGSGDTGMGGSGGIPSDSLTLPEDSTRSIDSMGVPDWNDQG